MQSTNESLAIGKVKLSVKWRDKEYHEHVWTLVCVVSKESFKGFSFFQRKRKQV